MVKRQFLPDGEGEKELKTPTMSRSRNQLASSYAPGAFFTFEGGLGACIALPDPSDPFDEAPIGEPTKIQIVLRLNEVWQSWFSRASAMTTPDRVIDARQCIDEMLLRGNAVHPLSGSDLAFVNPLKIGYAPAPLTFVCNHCGLFKDYKSASALSKDAASFATSKCRSPKSKGNCQWRQLDVVFVHWSGEWQPATPGMWEWSLNDKRKRLSKETCALCSSSQFLLNTQSPRIGEWYFQCANPACSDRRRTWLQNDPFTTEIFREDGSRRVSERRMEPISYRASSAFYAQSEQFVVFSEQDQGLLELLQEGRTTDLGNHIAKFFGYGGAAPTVDEMKDILLRGGHGDAWASYETMSEMLAFGLKQGNAKVIEGATAEQRKLIKGWFESQPPLIPRTSELPASLLVQLQRRPEFSSRFDPFALAVEHEALYRSKVSRTTAGGARAPFVRFSYLDKDLAPKDPERKALQEAKTSELMRKLGLAELGLIRDFELCKFTHGYSRVSATPVIEKRNVDMPVRLRLFESLRSGKRPIYVVTQANEAIYVRLDQAAVYNWLSAVGVTDLPQWTDGDDVQLGGRILERAEPFGRYFAGLRKADASTYRYVYTLLHSYAHVYMKAIAEFSGLDLGSMGEYLFPANLAFVVYRNGTTMDLGNLSSLWRNENNRFLGHLLEPPTYRCNSGSLCDFNGGACPDCIMVPETSCIAQNKLLSRAVLMGGLAPREDLTHRDERIPGFLEVLNA